VRRLSNISDATQQPETVQVITAQLPDGSLFYGIAVVPEREYNDYLPTFERVFDSVRFLR
jgi:predicted transcriptional regulator